MFQNGPGETLVSGGRLTERERLWGTLHLKDGRRLSLHPLAQFIKQMVTRELGFLPDSKASQDRQVIHIYWPFMTEIGMTVEEMNALLRETNAAAEESIHELEAALNKITTIRQVLTPKLVEIVKDVRQSRMTVESEMSQTFSALKNVRDFFLEKSYENEMTRMRDFIQVCKQVQSLKESGVLDAVADLAIKLAAGGEK